MCSMKKQSNLSGKNPVVNSGHKSRSFRSERNEEIVSVSDTSVSGGRKSHAVQTQVSNDEKEKGTKCISQKITVHVKHNSLQEHVTNLKDMLDVRYSINLDTLPRLTDQERWCYIRDILRRDKIISDRRDAIRQGMIRIFGGSDNKDKRRITRRILEDRHSLCCESKPTGFPFVDGSLLHLGKGKLRCDICDAHTICKKCLQCQPSKSRKHKHRNDTSFGNRQELHGLHHNMVFYDSDENSDCFARDLNIEFLKENQ